MQIYRHKFEATPKIRQNSIAHYILTTESNILKEFAERALSRSRIPSKANIFGRGGVLNGRNSSYKSYNWFLTDLNAGSPLKLRERKRECESWRSSSGGGDPKRERYVAHIKPTQRMVFVNEGGCWAIPGWHTSITPRHNCPVTQPTTLSDCSNNDDTVALRPGAFLTTVNLVRT